MSSADIKANDIITWKPEFADAGDEKYTFVALTDADEDGEFEVATREASGSIRPWAYAFTYMVESVTR